MQLKLDYYTIVNENYSIRPTYLGDMRVHLRFLLDGQVHNFYLRPKVICETKKINFPQNTYIKYVEKKENKHFIVKKELCLDGTSENYLQFIRAVKNKYNISNFEKKFRKDIQNLIDEFFQNYFEYELNKMGVSLNTHDFAA